MPNQTKKVSLLGGLIGEGLKIGFETFIKATKDEQAEIFKKQHKAIKETLDKIQRQSSSLRSVTFRKRFQMIINEFNDEMSIIEEEFKEDPVHAYFRLLMVPVFLLYELSSFIWGEFFNFLRARFEPEGPVSFDEAIHNAEEFLTLAGDFNVLATIFDILGDIQILGTKLPGRAIARFITNVSWTFGIGWLTWVVMGPVLRWSIADPYDREMRRRLRPRDWTRSELEDLYEREMVDREYLAKNFADMGYSDDKIELLLDLIDRKLIESEAKKYAGEVEDNYVYGYADEQDLFHALSFSNLTKDEIMFLIWRAQQRLINRLNDLRVKEIEKAYKADRISKEEAASRLSEFIKKPEMVERLLALWEQSKKPKEEIEPAERLMERKKRLEIRLKGLNDQITFLQEYLRERLELYDIMLKDLEDRYTSRIKRVTEVYDARIAAVKDEFTKYKEKKLREIEARIAEIDSELSRFVHINIAKFKGELERISDETLTLAGYTREAILNLFLDMRMDELLNVLAQLAIYTTPKEYKSVDRMLKIVNRYYDLVERRFLLETIGKIRIEEREVRVDALIKRLEAEKTRKVNELRAELERRKEILERRKRLEELRTNARISRLKYKAEEVSIELSSIKRQLEVIA